MGTHFPSRALCRRLMVLLILKLMSLNDEAGLLTSMTLLMITITNLFVIRFPLAPPSRSWLYPNSLLLLFSLAISCSLLLGKCVIFAILKSWSTKVAGNALSPLWRLFGGNDRTIEICQILSDRVVLITAPRTHSRLQVMWLLGLHDDSLAMSFDAVCRSTL